MITDFRALLKDLVEEVLDANQYMPPGVQSAVERARAALAEPQPEQPTDGEVAELVAVLRADAECVAAEQPDLMQITDQQLSRAAELLQRQHPQPVRVSERLPGPGDCDAEGRCWWLAPETAQKCAVWCFGPKYPPSMFGATHWLPAIALPLPQGEGWNDR